MSKTLQLHIPVPCHENWDTMSTQQQGRFCLSCQKTVVNFTTMTDAQILSYFKTAGSRTCGRFSTDQLNRNLSSPPKRKLGWFKYLFHFLIPAVLVSSKSYAQGEVKKRPAVCNTPIKPDRTERFLWGEVEPNIKGNSISGKVLDKDGHPLAGATIMIKGTKQGTLTDVQGYFKIEVQTPAHLIASFVGYTSYEMKVDQNSAMNPLTIVLDAMIMGDVTVVALPRRKPLVFHPFKKRISDSLRVSSLQLYPNPLRVQSRLTVEYACKKNGFYTIEIFDVNGKLLQADRVNVESKLLRRELRINESLAAGTYIVQLIDPSGMKAASQKVIVND